MGSGRGFRASGLRRRRRGGRGFLGISVIVVVVRPLLGFEMLRLQWTLLLRLLSVV
jgi:hypothetical protein